MAEAQPECFALDSGDDAEERGRLLTGDVSDQEQHPPYGATEGVPSPVDSSSPGARERLRQEVQQRAKAWGDTVTKTYQSERASASIDGDIELMPDYSSMPSRPLTPQGVAREVEQAPTGSPGVSTNVQSSGVEGLLQQMLAMQTQMMGRLEYLERQRLDSDRATETEKREMYYRLQLEAQQQDGTGRQVLDPQDGRASGRMLLGLPRGSGGLIPGSAGPSGSVAQDSAAIRDRSPLSQSAAELVELEHLLEEPGNMEVPVDSALSGELARLQLGVESSVGAAPEESARNLQATVPVVSGPPTKGQVELQGKIYCWTLNNEGLQLVPVDPEPPRSSRPSEVPHESIFTTRAQSPFVEVDQKEASYGVVNRTPSPSRKRGLATVWSGRRRSASRSPIRTSPLPSNSGTGKATAAVIRSSLDPLPAAGHVGSPPGLGGNNVEGLIARFESGNRGEGFRRVQISEEVPEPHTPKRPIKPRIVYPCSPGGTEIRPPAGTPPKTPLTGSPVQDTAVAGGSSASTRGRGAGERDRFTPGDKVWWSIPKLGEPDGQAAIKAGDWFTQLEVIMGDLSAGSGEWWQATVKCAREAYDRWASASALERLAVQPAVPDNLRGPEYTRLESRAFSMLQAGLPPSVLEELLASRSMSCVHALYQVLKTFQPGGLAERTRLLEALQSPGAGQNPKEVLDKLRLWMRHLNRASSMGISVPDSSILLKGLDGLCNPQLQKHLQTDFRMSVVRTRLSLDHAPTQATVSEYAKALQSEFSMLVLAGIDDQKGPKLKKVGDQGSGTGKGSDQKGADGKSGSGGGSGKKACKHWFTNAGCPWGARCTFAHSQPVTKGSGRCFLCSGLGHSKPNCPHKEGKGGAGGSGKDKGAEGSSKGKGEPAAKKVETPGAGSSSEAGPDTGKGGTGVANPATSNVEAGNVQAQLLKEATEALKALALRAMRRSEVAKMESSERSSGLLVEMAFCQEPVVCLAQCRGSEGVGLLDSGASVCLRRPKPGELVQCIKKQVTLAVGRECMWVNPLGTILSEEAQEPIVSLPQLIAIGYKFRWGGHGVELRNRKNQKIPVSLNGICPEVSQEWALRLIGEIEEHLSRGQQAKERVARLVAEGSSESPRDLLRIARLKLLAGESAGEEFRLWLAKVFPEVPHVWMDQVMADPSLDGEGAPWNRRQRRSMLTAKGGILVNLFSGSTRGKFGAVAAKHKLHLLDLDIGEDLTKQSTFSYLVALALCGKIKAIIGGPPCRTYSPCRLLPGGPPVARTRTGPHRWGKEGLSPKEAAKVATDNVLTIRMAALALAAYDSSLDLGLGETANLAEHPRDPP